MIKLETENLFNIENPQINKKEFVKQANKLPKYLNNIQQLDQGFYKVVNDNPTEIINYANSIKGVFNDIVIIGIGGSSLGNICLRDTLTHPFNKNKPKIHILDNVDPYTIEKLNDVIKYEKTLFIVISKSGGTPETLANYMYFRDKIENQKLDIKKHFVFITGEKGFLKEVSKEDNIKTFHVPENVGGRFSVLTSVGLLPAALMGIDIIQLLKGGKKYVETFLSEDFNTNTAFQFAAIQYLLNKNGVNITVLMPYSNRLKTFTDWYVQLLSESIGKEKDGVNIGITPLGALGTTDQHSQIQLFNEGPRDKMITFIEVKDHQSKITIPNIKKNHDKINFLKNTSFETLINTEKKATEDAITKYNKANTTIKIEKIDAFHLGELFLFFESATAFLGEFFEINAFNQPGVELGKVLTHKYLS